LLLGLSGGGPSFSRKGVFWVPVWSPLEEFQLIWWWWGGGEAIEW